MGRVRKVLGRYRRRLLGTGGSRSAVKDRSLEAKRAELARRRHFGRQDLEWLIAMIQSAESIVPAREAVAKTSPNVRTVVVRHDIDHDIENAVRFAEIEADLGVRATYFPLHTAWYYRPESTAEPSKLLLDALTRIRSLGHEIGLHNNAIAVALQTGQDAVEVLDRELAMLRRLGFDIVGTAAHGDRLCHAAGFVNSEIFTECRRDHLGAPDREIISSDASGRELRTRLRPVSMRDLGLEYEASYFGPRIYLSDAGGRWNMTLDRFAADFETLGGFTQILMHPEHWAFQGETVTPRPPRQETLHRPPARASSRLRIIVRGDCCSRRAINLNRGLFGGDPEVIIDEKSRTDFFLDHLTTGSATPEDVERYLDLDPMSKSLKHYVVHQTDRATLAVEDAQLLVMDNYADMNFKAWRHREKGWMLWVNPKFIRDREVFARDFEPYGLLTYEESLANHLALIEHYRSLNGSLPVLYMNQPIAYYPNLEQRREFEQLGADLEKMLPDVYYGMIPDADLEPDDMDSSGPGRTLHFTGPTYRKMIDVAAEKGLKEWLSRIPSPS